MKKLYVIIAAVLLSLTLCPVIAQARGSEAINDYWAGIREGDSRGEILIQYAVRATDIFPKLGALKIMIYKSNGDYITTTWGTTANGLLSPVSESHYAYTYPYNGIPGTSYYAVVTVCAGEATDYVTREVTTSVVRAPY